MTNSAEKQSQIKVLIALGKEKGFLTYAEVSDHLPEVVDSEQIDDVISMIQTMGIQVHDEAPDEESQLFSEPAVVASAEEEEDAAEEAAAALAALGYSVVYRALVGVGGQCGLAGAARLLAGVRATAPATGVLVRTRPRGLDVPAVAETVMAVTQTPPGRMPRVVERDGVRRMSCVMLARCVSSSSR